MQRPIATDTEAETSVDFDKSVSQLKRVSQGNATKSIFNITLDKALEEETSIEFRNYETRLKEEIKQWGDLWRDSIQKLKSFERHPHAVVDKSLLSPDKLDYLNKAPDLQRFLRDSVEFRRLLYVTVNKDLAELQDAQQNLKEVCEHAIKVSKERKIAQNLANK